MERWERPQHRGRSNPSFSSSLLDAIYRSIDGESIGGAPDPAISVALPFFSSSPSKKRQSSVDLLRTSAVAVTDLPLTRRISSDQQYRCHRLHGAFFTPTSYSSDASSFGGWSSDVDSSAHPLPAPANPEKKKKKPSSFRSRFRDFRKGRGPASPGARLASFLNALFSAAAGGTPKKAKIADPPAPRPKTAPSGGGGGEESWCSSSSSSSSSSCLSTARWSRGRPLPETRKSVAVNENSRPCGRRRLDDGHLETAVVAMRWKNKKRAEELLIEEEEEDEDEKSDSSSDLFELENLTVIGGGYRHELPVYETTHLGTNRAIAQCLIP